MWRPMLDDQKARTDQSDGFYLHLLLLGGAMAMVVVAVVMLDKIERRCVFGRKRRGKIGSVL